MQQCTQYLHPKDENEDEDEDENENEQELFFYKKF